MCVVSMVTDHYRDKWPFPVIPLMPNDLPFKPAPLDKDAVRRIFDKYPPQTAAPAPVGPVFQLISAEQWLEYQELKRKAAEYDVRNNEPHCEKPGVDEWENDIESFLILMGLLTEEDFA